MDWILNHLFVVVFVAIAVANVLQKVKRAGMQQQARRTLDADATERTRRVQEEIRRKIAGRAGRLPMDPPVVSTGPTAGPPARNIFQELARQMAEAKMTAERQERARAAAEAQAQQRREDEQKSRELAEARQLAEAQRTRESQPQPAAAVAHGATGQKTTGANARGKLQASLREPDSLRRAWLWREILGEPMAMR